jgi:hypothetical protein
LARRTAKRVIRKPRPVNLPKQDIPKEIEKGDPVLYMLERISQEHCRYINGVCSKRFKKWERFILDLFKDKAFVMSPKTKKPRVGHHVKFGISENVRERVDTINKGMFKTGTTEWRELSHTEMILANCYFYYWRHRAKIYLALFLGFVLAWMIIF